MPVPVVSKNTNELKTGVPRAIRIRSVYAWLAIGAIAEPVPRRLVSANFENASRIRAFGLRSCFWTRRAPTFDLNTGRAQKGRQRGMRKQVDWLCLLFIHPRVPNLIGLRSAETMPA